MNECCVVNNLQYRKCIQNNLLIIFEFVSSHSLLQSALLIHSPFVQQSSDDLLHTNPHPRNHPLDSNLTTDVLRYLSS